MNAWNLAPYAVPINGTIGRVHDEPDDAHRTAFQRDRDRIIHSQAFRRLKGKTQVFVEGVGDHYRTRLTHTMEVAQISRDIARTLHLNEDLAECIALAHDLGHPPFGHAGEEALNTWMQKYGEQFEHNQQSLRVVTILEEHSKLCPGLNVNEEVLEGLMKHRTLNPNVDEPSRAPTLEAQLVDLSDAIAYTAHDTDDGIRAKLFSVEDITDIPLAHDAYLQAKKRGTKLRGALIDLVVADLYATSMQAIEAASLQSIDDVYDRNQKLIRLSDDMQQKFTDLHAFLYERMYRHPTVAGLNKHGQNILLALCSHYSTNPPTKVLDLQARTKSSQDIAIKDYIAGMTDRYAKEKFEEIT